MFDFDKDFGSKLFSDTVMKQRLRPEIYETVRKIRDEKIWKESFIWNIQKFRQCLNF